MIPSFNFIDENNLNTEFKDLTYRIDFLNNRVIGKIDGLEAVKQSILKILQTERYANIIYSNNYGSEIERFIGKDIDFIKADLERTIADALKSDERIIGISNFNILSFENSELLFEFQVNTTLGQLLMNGGVNI